LSCLSRLRAWLSPADAPGRVDLIFVLAGKMLRKEYALELFRRGLAPGILLSVGRFEIRRFSKMDLPVPLDLLKLAQEISPSQRHYFVLFEGQNVRVEHVPPKRFGTLTEIAALAHWLSMHPEVRSIAVISNATHLRRIRMCCRALIDTNLAMKFLGAAGRASEVSGVATTLRGEPRFSEAEDESARESAEETLRELFKVIVYWGLLKFPRKR
jgi:hypothetical protein